MHNLLADDSVFGVINPPAPVAQSYGVLGAGSPGLTGFISNIIILITIIGGIIALFNIVTGGLTLITAEGSSKAMEELGNKLTMTLVGIIVMVGAPLIAALIGYFVFGKADMLLNPSIPSPLGAAGGLSGLGGL